MLRATIKATKAVICPHNSADMEVEIEVHKVRDLLNGISDDEILEIFPRETIEAYLKKKR